MPSVRGVLSPPLGIGTIVPPSDDVRAVAGPGADVIVIVGADRG
jgi:hypothetical protein